MPNSRVRLRDTGVLAAVVTSGSLLLATLVSPAFVWREHALSNLGVNTTAPGTTVTVVLFNGGLVVGGLIGLAYAYYRYVTAEAGLGRLLGLSFTLTMLTMVGIGLFPQGQPAHIPAAVGFYLLISVTLGIDALSAVVRGKWRWAAAAGALSASNLAVWVGWSLTGDVTRDGLAIPEFAGAVIFVAWIVASTGRHRRTAGQRTEDPRA